MSGKARTSRQDLTPLLHARSLAIVGISRPERFGGRLFTNLQRFGYAGRIFGVNPRYDTLYDQPCYPSLAELPERPDCALLAVPNAGIVEALEETAARGIPAAVIFASAWSEPGEEPSLQQRLADVARKHELVVCGPNCMGFVAPGRRLAVSGYDTDPGTPAGNVAVVSHSGSVFEALLQNRHGVAFNYVVSSGNEVVTTVADYLQFALADPETRAIGIFLETVRDPRTFTAALAEAAERDVPVVVLKTGRSEQGARLARAHSGALAGEDGAYEALFSHYGVHRVTSIDEMLDTLELFATGMRPRTRGVSALLDSGGQRAMLVDLAEAEGVEFAAIGEATRERLAELLEPGLEPINPLDAWGTGNAAEDIYAECLLALDADPATGLNLFAVDLYPLDDGSPTSYPPIVAPLRERLRNPLAFLVHASTSTSPAQLEALRGMGIPVLMGTETGLRAVRHVIEHAARGRRRDAAPRAAEVEVPRPADPAALARELEAGETLDEHASKDLLRHYGLTPTREVLAESLDAALSAAEEIGYPLALKTAGGDLHKTERGGVRLGLPDAEALRRAYRDFAGRLSPRVLVQEMVPPGPELILGVVHDAQFGPLLTVGTGGIFVEVMKDARMLLLPTTEEAVREALANLRGAALLRGVRGRPAADVEAVVRAALGLSALALDLGDHIAEIDVNPLVALPDRAVVVDALIVTRSP